MRGLGSEGGDQVTLEDIERLEQQVFVAKKMFLRMRGWDQTNRGLNAVFVKVINDKQITGDTEFALQYERNFQ